jgi:hypothetical protein
MQGFPTELDGQEKPPSLVQDYTSPHLFTASQMLYKPTHTVVYAMEKTKHGWRGNEVLQMSGKYRWRIRFANCPDLPIPHSLSCEFQ